MNMQKNKIFLTSQKNMVFDAISIGEGFNGRYFSRILGEKKEKRQL